MVEVLEGPLPMAVVDMAGEQRTCSAMYVPEVQVGQYVLVQRVQLAPREPR
ncbi:HypC/HybG/HupF family hydrogenase formation chaperone [Corynebacterium rouxii]|uniref:HypC/HybG/HupF family hydrogenase formation chaperone n=1 Tax=Corynebacterium rouxii TaxID=2719119 RepID=A0ABU3PL16_9CORY|nr:HypC/HybG/HupF family hydrogenase formation chaperone [Corynebacterium rouxii]MDT9408343.1 HypC/HybG/HupF family hydrogenase formation chaperone [Corynebacterium rouxii]MDT9410522.1 HypC/HybG/HupF family hydrogenase formation chaperone [Corynebacterium rouxii]